IAPESRLSLMKLLKRAIAIATRAFGVATTPSITFIGFPLNGFKSSAFNNPSLAQPQGGGFYHNIPMSGHAIYKPMHDRGILQTGPWPPAGDSVTHQ